MQGNFMCRSMLVLHQKMEEYSEKLVSRYGKLILRTTTSRFGSPGVYVNFLGDEGEERIRASYGVN